MLQLHNFHMHHLVKPISNICGVRMYYLLLLIWKKKLQSFIVS